MGNTDYFANLGQYFFANISVGAFFLTEFLILIFTSKGEHKSKNKDKKKSDGGTVWLMIISVWVSIFFDLFLESEMMPQPFRTFLLPYAFYFIGEFLIYFGIAVRVTAILTLKRSFTLTVQTTKNQHLIDTGLYKIVRNPAYTGTILSVIGISLCYRHIVALIVCLVLLFFAYSRRISIEEKALSEQFGDEFKTYCNKTKYRVFPFLY